MGMTRHHAAADGTRYRYAADGWGIGEIVVREGRLVDHALASRHGGCSPRGRGPHGGTSPPDFTLAGSPSQESDDFVPSLCRRFAAHLEGIPVAYDDVVLDDDHLTPFQRELLAAARSVGWGEVVTYGGLADLAGRPRAARAAGTSARGTAGRSSFPATGSSRPARTSRSSSEGTAPAVIP